jgi:SAM-dependent methyltransferase
MGTDHQAEIARIGAVYERRQYDVDQEYSDLNPVYLHRIQTLERWYLDALRLTGLDTRLAELKVLDYGCGNGRWFGRWLAWGAQPANLVGVDVREAALDMARRSFPHCRFGTLESAGSLLAAGTYDIVFQNLVLSSILDDELRRATAADMIRVVKPGGTILICDFRFDNPRNPDVRAVRSSEVLDLFRGCALVRSRRAVLAPPLARVVVPRSWFAAVALEQCLPFLRTHLCLVLRKPARVD